MQRIFSAFVLIGFACSCPAGQFINNQGPKVAEEFIVVYGEDIDLSRATDAIRTRYGRSKTRRIFHNSLHAAHVSGLYEYEAREFANDPDVLWIEPNSVYSGSLVQSVPVDAWGLDRIDQRTLPLSGDYSYEMSGQGVDIFVIDSGIMTTHAEFSGRASIAFDALQDGQNGTDCNGHGTHVAAIAAGKRFGVAKNAWLHAVRVLGCDNQGTTADIIAGVDYVTAQKKANPAARMVANMSIQGNNSNAMDTAVANSIAAGVFYAVAAGNFGRDACGTSPARTPQAFTVAASDRADNRANFSNYGRCVDIFAPGDNIRSAGIRTVNATAILSGTSMAAPHVTGSAALVIEEFPAADVDEISQTLRLRATRDVVINAGQSSPNSLVNIHPNPDTTVADTILVSRAEWIAAKNTLQFEGTISDPTAELTLNVGTLRVFLVNDRGRFRGQIAGVFVNPATVRFTSGSGTFVIAPVVAR